MTMMMMKASCLEQCTGNSLVLNFFLVISNSKPDMRAHTVLSRVSSGPCYTGVFSACEIRVLTLKESF